MSKKTDAEFAEMLDRVVRRCVSWGDLERAAGVTDRVAFWAGKSEYQAREVLRGLIAGRLRRGEIGLDAHGFNVAESPP